MMGWLEARHFVLAVDAASIVAAVRHRGWRGWRLGRVSRAALRPGALLPSAFDPNVAAPDEVEGALRTALTGVGAVGHAATLVLPHGIARTAVLEVPRGATPEEYARFRLGAGLPYPPEEALVDFVPLGNGRILAAAVRRDIVAEYEQLAAAAGRTGGRVDLAPLAAAAAIPACAHDWPDPSVLLVLGDRALSLVAVEGRRVVGFRTRRRDPASGEAERLRADALSTAVAAGVLGEPDLLVTGFGARSVVDDLSGGGCSIRLAALSAAAVGSLEEAGPLPWLAAAVP